MKIVVCVRQSVSGEINPFDACAYEAALQVEGAEVILLSMGPNKSFEFLKSLTRLGAKEAYLLSDSAFAGADTLATSYTLSLAIKRLAPDLVFCGRQTVDGDTGQVGPELSVMAGYNFIANAMKINVLDGKIEVTNRNGDKIVENFPTLITVERINSLRLPSLRGKVKEVYVWDAAELSADTSKCGHRGSPTKVLRSFENTKDRRKCKFINFSELDGVIAEALQKERIEIKSESSAKKLDGVWSIGEAPLSMAATVSDNVRVVDMDTAESLVKKITGEKPSVIIWGSDPESKTVSAKVAAMLGLGLCADCTKLETDGEKLFMYRPAFGGNIIAKIESKTLPQMATVRTLTDSSDIIVSLGKGVVGKLDEAKARAAKYAAELGASRAMVDAGYMPYSAQIGLTGKTVCPKVYIALGISGAVHHTSAIENAGTVIAINPDRDARIFEYADYGIVAEF